uniref:RING-type domain-containing protein n=1 Tax=Panagrolaimus sp. JU765 TaxID=591449 RepID=A0AC34PYR9_9BILA
MDNPTNIDPTDLRCGVCLEDFSRARAPMAMNCGHIFCRYCWLKMQEGIIIHCCLCRQITVKGLGTHGPINTLLNVIDGIHPLETRDEQREPTPMTPTMISNEVLSTINPDFLLEHFGKEAHSLTGYSGLIAQMSLNSLAKANFVAMDRFNDQQYLTVRNNTKTIINGLNKVREAMKSNTEIMEAITAAENVPVDVTDIDYAEEYRILNREVRLNNVIDNHQPIQRGFHGMFPGYSNGFVNVRDEEFSIDDERGGYYLL